MRCMGRTARDAREYVVLCRPPAATSRPHPKEYTFVVDPPPQMMPTQIIRRGSLLLRRWVYSSSVRRVELSRYSGIVKYAPPTQMVAVPRAGRILIPPACRLDQRVRPCWD